MNFWRPTDALCSSVQVSSQTHRRQKLSCSPSLPSMRCQTIWALRPFPDTILLQLHIIWYAQACGAAAFSSRVGWLRSSGALWAEAPQVLPGLDNPHKAPCFTLPAAEHRLLSHALSAAWLCLRNPGEPWRCGRCGPQLPPHTRALLLRFSPKGSKAELQLWMQAMSEAKLLLACLSSSRVPDAFRSTQFTSLDDAFWSW